MIKGNPLFVDSTKFHGDGIDVQVELNDFQPRREEKIYLIVTDIRGEKEKVELRAKEEGGYRGTIYLKHQQEVDFQFIVERDEKILFKSPQKRKKANYMIIESWDPEEYSPNVNLFVEPKWKDLLKKWDF